MYGISGVTTQEIHKNFCKWFNIKQQKISDKKFSQILNICWQAGYSMQFMGSALGDGEDFAFAREYNYKDFVLFNLYDYYCWNDDIRFKIQRLFNAKESDNGNKL